MCVSCAEKQSKLVQAEELWASTPKMDVTQKNSHSSGSNSTEFEQAANLMGDLKGFFFEPPPSEAEDPVAGNL